MNLKPKSLVDIRRRNSPDSFNSRSKRINLSFKRKSFIKRTLSQIAPYAFVALLVTLVNGKVLAPIITPDTLAQSIQITTSERKQLEKELKEYEAQIAEYENTIREYSRQGRTLKDEINILNTKISKLNLQIRAVNASIYKLDDEINSTSVKIEETQQSLEEKKETLTKTIKNIYVSDRADYLQVLLKNSEISDFFTNINSLFLLQDNLRVVLEDLSTSQEQLTEYKEQLSLKKSDTVALKAYQDSQKAQIVSTKAEKDTILEITKGKESEYQKYLQDTKQKAAEIRSRIFQFLGGGELTFEKAYELAKYAEGATGVRAAMLLAILDKESALGANVGRCGYESAMHPTRDIPIFLKIISELGLQADLANGIIKVSCAISSDGAYGGAMGPAQFIPSTWDMYKNRIGRITGNNPPSPWSNTDAIIGTALYIKDARDSRDCQNYINEYSNIAPAQILGDRCAAAKYYAGGNWWHYRWAYGEPVIERADRFQRDIDLLNS